MIDKIVRAAKNILRDPRKIINYMNSFGWLKPLSDETCLKLLYWAIMGKKLDLKNPKTFNEKLQWLKIHDHNPNYIKLVDKYEVKSIVGNIIGEEHIIPTIGVWDRFEDINFDKLPEQFVLKCTHDSGGLVICKDKSKLDMQAARKKINSCLKRNFYWSGREGPYKDVKPRVLAEQYMEDTQTQELRDYKFMCFNGKVRCSFVCSDRFTGDGLKVTFFDTDWNVMPFERHYPKSERPIPKPNFYAQMVEFAEKLSRGIPFVRVDFYEVGGKVFFGELTFYPGNGMEEFTPEEWDATLGSWIVLPKED